MARMTAPPAHTTLAYLRVSTLDQDIEKNKADILRFANQHDLGRVRSGEARLGWEGRGRHGRRSLGEVAMFRYKKLIGRSLHARTPPTRKIEAKVACKV